MKLRLNTPQNSWQRPSIRGPSGSSDTSMVQSLVSDLQDDIRHAFAAEIYRRKKGCRFPRDNGISIVINIKSKSDCSLPLVIKNVLDALNGFAFTDDSILDGVYGHLEISDEDTISIGILFDRKFRSCDDISSLMTQTFVNFDVYTKPIDTIMPIPMYPSDTITANPNNMVWQECVKQEVYKQYKYTTITSDVFIGFDVHTTSQKSDIDNICLNHIQGMKDLVFNDLKQIKTLWMNIYRQNGEYADVTIDNP